MSDADLRREMERLAARLAQIERRLGIEPDAESEIESPTTPPIAPTESHDLREAGKAGPFHRLFPTPPAAVSIPPIASAPPTAPSPPIAPEIRTPPVYVVPRVAHTPPVIPLQPAPPPPVAPPPISAQPKPARKTPTPSLEVLIGGKWMAWVGALAVILAAGFLVKIGVDQGWWGRLPPLTRCLGIAGFGALLLIVGEIALRRIGKPAAAGLMSAGLGTLYLDAYAAARVFELLSVEGAFILMALVAFGGFALTVRSRFLTIGVLSIIGGYLTPILLQGESQHDLALLLYLTMLLAIALALAGLWPQTFGALRFVALGGHALIAFGWLWMNLAQWQMALFFITAWWSMVLAESVFTALKNHSAIGNVVMTLLATVAYVTAGCMVLRARPPTSAEWTGVFTTMVALLGAAAAMQFGSGLDALRGRRRTAIDLLSVGLWLQSGVLVATAIALQFENFGEAIGWMTFGLAAIEMGRRLPSRGVIIFGLCVGALATLRVISIPILHALGTTPQSLRPLFTIAEFEISPWTLLAIANVVMIHLAAHRLPALPQWRTRHILLIVLASLLWMGMCMTQGHGLSVTAGWLIYIAALLAMERLPFTRAAAYLEIALVMLAATAARWLLFDGLANRFSSEWRADDANAFLNAQMALAVAIAAMGWWACRVLGRRAFEAEYQEQASPRLSGSLFWQIVLVCGSIFALVAVCFEIDRGVSQTALSRAAGTFAPMHVRQLLFTLAWAIGSVLAAVIVRTFVAGNTSNAAISRTWLLRRFAWSVLIICALKWIAWDAPSLLLVNRKLFDNTWPLMNLQMFVGIALAAAMMLVSVIMRRDGATAATIAPRQPAMLTLPRDLAAWIPVGAGMIILWGLSFEVDRFLVQAAPLPDYLGAFSPLHLRALCWTALWASGAAVMLALGFKRSHAAPFCSGIVISALAAVSWLTLGTVAWRLSDGPVAVMPVMNLQFVVGVLCAVVLAAAGWIVRSLPAVQIDRADPNFALLPAAPSSLEPRTLAHGLLALVATIGLWLGSIEIDRIFAAEPMVRQSVLSVWWALYSVGLVVMGFARRLASARYAGLGLLSLTVVKVLLVDLAFLDDLPRVLSFAAAGLLLIITSVVYAKLSPRLLGEDEEDAREQQQASDS